MDPKEQIKLLIKNSTKTIYGYVAMCVFFLSIQTFVYFKYISDNRWNLSYFAIAVVMILLTIKLVSLENKRKQKLVAISKRIK